jgi:ParB family chromosome partitioning protein
MTTVRMIPIDKVHVLNPRSRGRAKFKEIVSNISKIGLKKPIMVSVRGGDEEGYDLVCGQGRLEAFQALGQNEVPASSSMCRARTATS